MAPLQWENEAWLVFTLVRHSDTCTLGGVKQFRVREKIGLLSFLCCMIQPFEPVLGAQSFWKPTGSKTEYPGWRWVPNRWNVSGLPLFRMFLVQHICLPNLTEGCLLQACRSRQWNLFGDVTEYLRCRYRGQRKFLQRAYVSIRLCY